MATESTEDGWIGRQGSPDERRLSVMRSIGRVLRQSRFSTLTMQAIAEQLGVTKGNLYYYFSDKQDLLLQFHVFCVDISLNILSEERARAGSSADKLQAVLRRHILVLLEEGLGSVMVADLENAPAERLGAYISKRDEFEHGVRDLIQLGVEEGSFECPDPRIAGFAILGSINWIPRWYHADGELTPSQIADDMVTFFLAGLWTRGSDVLTTGEAPSLALRQPNS
ncbi:TetR/AcrR family transcriptional regulator [Devosia ginsengisoli]|uniref:TetR/AcrR family transcriptional regulator n=2 Tax=Devosia ginsengisoli TaxID=400770 RepID=A0A5B8LZZ6_9HYPH|nr:TetR/AcrR family transcriptional regulator [Devosia ginsengisoli]